MTDPRMPASFPREWQALKDRISKLERLPRLPSSSFQGGLFQFLDNDKNIHWGAGNNIIDATAGSFTGGSQEVENAYGVVSYDTFGAIHNAEVDGFSGRAYPSTPFPMHSPASTSVTSSSFAAVFEAEADTVVGDVLLVSGAVIAQNCAGELRLSTSGQADVTDSLSIPSGTNGTYTFMWLHPAACGLGGNANTGRNTFLYASLDARRVSGTGTLFVFPPRVSEITNAWLARQAASNGNPFLS